MSASESESQQIFPNHHELVFHVIGMSGDEQREHTLHKLHRYLLLGQVEPVIQVLADASEDEPKEVFEVVCGFADEMCGDSERERTMRRLLDLGNLIIRNNEDSKENRFPMADKTRLMELGIFLSAHLDNDHPEYADEQASPNNDTHLETKKRLSQLDASLAAQSRVASSAVIHRVNELADWQDKFALLESVILPDQEKHLVNLFYDRLIISCAERAPTLAEALKACERTPRTELGRRALLEAHDTVMLKFAKAAQTPQDAFAILRRNALTEEGNEACGRLHDELLFSCIDQAASPEDLARYLSMQARTPGGIYRLDKLRQEYGWT